jgi:hypothetical protein
MELINDYSVTFSGDQKMSTCKFCGKDAGFLRSAHKECLRINVEGNKEIADLLLASARGKLNLEVGVTDVKKIASNSFIDHEALNLAVIENFGCAVDLALDDDLLTQE